MTEPSDVLVQIRHMNYWWGIYGLCDPTSWEDVLLHVREPGQSDARRIGAFCACGRSFFKGLDELRGDPAEADWVARADRYLAGDRIVPDMARPQLRDPDAGPPFLDLWHPSPGIDEQAMHDCVRYYALHYLGLEIGKIEYLEVETFDEALESFRELPEVFDIEIPEQILNTLAARLDTPRGIVLDRIRDSVGPAAVVRVAPPDATEIARDAE
jgi:hypothetical protein